MLLSEQLFNYAPWANVIIINAQFLTLFSIIWKINFWPMSYLSIYKYLKGKLKNENTKFSGKNLATTQNARKNLFSHPYRVKVFSFLYVNLTNVNIGRVAKCYDSLNKFDRKEFHVI